ncbi:ion channel [Exiguobacterium profundum]|uniref:ion channel n=1 Tax=Exiguobacterium profundum TaxID=307643 RepID=UPI0029C46580|nr:ion channel [Exiguobacterium profundum]MDX5980600.1 ion channel [Exiguobacterium profundum]
MHILFRVWKGLAKLSFLNVVLASIGIIILGTVLGYVLEPETFGSLFDSFWWTMTTLTTVGYGDFYPSSVAGRWLGIFLFLFGIGIIGALIGKLVEIGATFQRLKREGRLVYRGEGHYVYIGWSPKTKKAIDEVLNYEPKAEIVLIDQLVEEPYMHDQVHFVSGDASDEAVLLQANVLKARRVAIFADARITETLLADGKSLLIASAVEALSSEHQVDLQTVVEVCEERNISKFKHVRVDDFILANDSVSLLMAKATLHPGTTAIFRQLLSKQSGGNIQALKPKAEWQNVRQANTALLESGGTLIAVNDRIDVATMLDLPLQDTDMLYVICHDDVFERLS